MRAIKVGAFFYSKTNNPRQFIAKIEEILEGELFKVQTLDLKTGALNAEILHESNLDLADDAGPIVNNEILKAMDRLLHFNNCCCATPATSSVAPTAKPIIAIE